MMEAKVSGKKVLGLSEVPLFIWLLGNDFISVPHFTVECSYSNWIMILMGYLWSLFCFQSTQEIQAVYNRNLSL